MNANTEMTTEATDAPEMTPKERVQAWIDKYHATMAVKFIPWSQSRNANKMHPSLNYEVTISREGLHAEMTTDYSMGCGHCPAYKTQGKDRLLSRKRIQWECENGRQSIVVSHDIFSSRSVKPTLWPSFPDVLYSLSMDSSVLDSPGYEAWANEYGYDEDSRKGEAIYRACLDIALKMRSMFGDAGMQELAEACQDY